MTYPLIGLALAIGAPAGLALVRWIAFGAPEVRAFVFGELTASFLTYGYLLVSTAAVFVTLGLRLGAQEDALQNLSITDALTGIPNRRHFNLRLEHELTRSRRHHVPTSLAVIDIDGLKRINDDHGHETGDRVLSAVARTIRETIRSLDVVARIGGDEFGVIMPLTEAREAERVAERVRASIEPLGARLVPISISVGVADLSQVGAPTSVDLFTAADRALYDAKAAGRNRVVIAATPRPMTEVPRSVGLM